VGNLTIGLVCALLVALVFYICNLVIQHVLYDLLIEGVLLDVLVKYPECIILALEVLVPNVTRYLHLAHIDHLDITEGAEGVLSV
jgi:hypothetical protein